MNIQELHDRAMSDAIALVNARLNYANALHRVRAALPGRHVTAAVVVAKAALSAVDAAYLAATASAAACCAAVPVGSSMADALRA